MANFSLVLHFNAFSGKLEGGYLMRRENKTRFGDYMNPTKVLAYMATNPDVRCAPLKV